MDRDGSDEERLKLILTRAGAYLAGEEDDRAFYPVIGIRWSMILEIAKISTEYVSRKGKQVFASMHNGQRGGLV